MQIDGVFPPAVDTTRSAEPPRDPQKVREAAQQFESLLISQMLKSMRESGNSWLGTDGDSASESAVGMAEEELAKPSVPRADLGWLDWSRPV